MPETPAKIHLSDLPEHFQDLVGGVVSFLKGRGFSVIDRDFTYSIEAYAKGEKYVAKLDIKRKKIVSLAKPDADLLVIYSIGEFFRIYISEGETMCLAQSFDREIVSERTRETHAVYTLEKSTLNEMLTAIFPEPQQQTEPPKSMHSKLNLINERLRIQIENL